MLLGLWALASCGMWTAEPAPRWTFEPAEQPHLVLFVVLDTLRSDHLSLCDYERPTTPVLEQLVRDGAEATCTAVSPASWTIPSHASYFTGLPVPEHRADREGRPLPQQLETLAEHMADKGYQTAMVSANGLLEDVSGLTRGFQHTDVARPKDHRLRKGKLPDAVDRTLDQIDADQPLFLFVNIFDAHDPWDAVPEGLDWVEPQRGVRLKATSPDPDDPVNKYVTGRMPSRAAGRYLRRIGNAYDHGIHQADDNLGHVLELLQRRGWLAKGVRLVVTSDHGEFLGEHQMLRHGCFVYEPVVRVPLLVLDSTGPTPALGEEPISAMAAHGLVRDGRLPDAGPVATYSHNRHEAFRGSADMMAVYDGHDKLVWQEGEIWQVDWFADPLEASPRPLGDDPRRAEIEAMAAAYQQAMADGSEGSDELKQLLEQLGYVAD